MEEARSILSAGVALFDMLSRGLGDGVTRVYPVVIDEARLPYVAFRRSGLSQTAVQKGRGAFSAVFEVGCYAADYAGSVRLAERVRALLDGARYEGGGLAVRSCELVNASEEWADDAYVQWLVFEVRC